MKTQVETQIKTARRPQLPGGGQEAPGGEPKTKGALQSTWTFSCLCVSCSKVCFTSLKGNSACG